MLEGNRKLMILLSEYIIGLKTQSDLDQSSPQLQAISFHDLIDGSRRDTSWPALHTVPTCRDQTEITCTRCLHTLDMYNKR